jgi:hypothetical protein
MTRRPREIEGSVITGGDRIDQQMFADAKRDMGYPTVNVAHPRTGVWSGKNQLGVELPFELDANNRQTIFKMDEWGFPKVWTVSLGIELPKALKQGQIFDVVAIVNFGSGGIMQEFEVDWVVGTVFSLPMNAINVRARWSDRALIEGVQPPEGIRVSTLIAQYGLRHARATFTNFFGNLAGDDSVVVPNPPGAPIFQAIPAFAKSVIVTPATPGDAAAIYAAGSSLSFFQNDNTAVPSFIQSVPGDLLGPTIGFKVPIPATARYWTFTNGAGNPPATGNVIWTLFDES